MLKRMLRLLSKKWCDFWGRIACAVNAHYWQGTFITDDKGTVIKKHYYCIRCRKQGRMDMYGNS